MLTSRIKDMDVKVPKKIPIKLGYIELPLTVRFDKVIRMAIIEVKVGSTVKRELIYGAKRLKLNFVIEEPKPGVNTLEIRVIRGPKTLYYKKLVVEFIEDPVSDVFMVARRIDETLYRILIEVSLRKRVDKLILRLNRYDPYTLLPLTKPVAHFELEELKKGKHVFDLGIHDLAIEHELLVISQYMGLTWDRSIFIPCI